MALAGVAECGLHCGGDGQTVDRGRCHRWGAVAERIGAGRDAVTEADAGGYQRGHGSEPNGKAEIGIGAAPRLCGWRSVSEERVRFCGWPSGVLVGARNDRLGNGGGCGHLTGLSLLLLT